MLGIFMGAALGGLLYKLVKTKQVAFQKVVAVILEIKMARFFFHFFKNFFSLDVDFVFSSTVTFKV